MLTGHDLRSGSIFLPLTSTEHDRLDPNVSSSPVADSTLRGEKSYSQHKHSRETNQEHVFLLNLVFYQDKKPPVPKPYPPTTEAVGLKPKGVKPFVCRSLVIRLWTTDAATDAATGGEVSHMIYSWKQKV